MQTQPLQQNSLMIGRLAHATAADFRSRPGGQHHIDHPDPSQFFQHPLWLKIWLQGNRSSLQQLTDLDSASGTNPVDVVDYA